MAFFKLLSDQKEDHETEVAQINEKEDALGTITDSNSCMELVLDTGEHFVIPISWLIEKARDELLKKNSPDSVH